MRVTARSRSGVGGGGGGGLELVDYYVHEGTAIQSFLFGDGGDGANTAAIEDGYIYQLEGVIIPGTSASLNIYSVRPNSLTTAMDREVYGSNSGAFTGAGTTTTGWRIAGDVSLTLVPFSLKIFNLADIDRCAFVRYAHPLAASVKNVFGGAYLWTQTQTETPLTSLQLHCDQTDGFAAGSAVYLYRFAKV